MATNPSRICAAREIREETGMEAGTLTHVGSFYLAPGYSTEYMGVFLAKDLKHNPLEADADEFLSVEKIASEAKPSKWPSAARCPTQNPWQRCCWHVRIWKNTKNKIECPQPTQIKDTYPQFC
jgi:8-oxo-dGTP pyrophosphatase MutT (NUDIX family)